MHLNKTLPAKKRYYTFMGTRFERPIYRPRNRGAALVQPPSSDPRFNHALRRAKPPADGLG